jgi:thymidylate kinase
MLKAVELIGPSGSGKTAIYMALKSKWRPEYNWVTFDDHNYSGKRVDRAFLNAIKNRLSKLISPLENRARAEMNPQWKFIDFDNRIYLGDEYDYMKTDLMNLVEEHCSKGFDGSDKRFNTIYMLMWSMGHLDKIKSRKDDHRFCILKQGEGLVSRIMHLCTPSFDENALQKYMEMIPLPEVIFQLDISVDEVMKRIQHRKRTSSLHKGMDEEILYSYTVKTHNYLKKSCEIAERAGSVVIHIDVESDVEESTDKIIESLSSLTNTR